MKSTDALNCSFFGITTLHVSGSLSAHHQQFLAVHRLWYILCSCDDRLLPGVGWNCHGMLMTGRKAARNMYSRNTNKTAIQCICWFHSQGICYDARSDDRKKKSNSKFRVFWNIPPLRPVN